MNTLKSEQREYLLDKLRIMGTLQQWLWEEAITVADDLLDCELEAVLKYIPHLAISGSVNLGNEDLDHFLDHCRRTVGCHAVQVDLARRKANWSPRSDLA